MELYMCNSIDELNQQSEVNSASLKNRTPKQLILSAEKLLKKASDCQARGDAEASYVFYMKYLNIVSIMKKLPDFKKDEKFYTQLLGPKNVCNAIAKAEALNTDLRLRYQLREEKKIEKLKREQTTEKKPTSTAKPQEDQSVKINTCGISRDSTIIENQTTISSWGLDTMIKQKSKSFMIFDVRSAVDFEKSHIKHSNCCSVPEEILKPGGLSAASLYGQLPLPTRVEWKRRLDVDIIVLVDWFGEDIPGTAIHALKEIMTKWDPNSTYQGTIKVLSGGYDDWLIRFPLQTTNPHVTSIVKVPDPLPIPSVDHIDYPDFDTSYFNAREIPSTDSKKEEYVPISTEMKSLVPSVNRSTKPSLDSRQNPDQNTEWKKASEGSHASTLIANSQPQTPLDKEHQQPQPVAKSTPTVDRSLKHQAIMKYLQDEESMMEKSLALAQQQLEKEREWERIRLEREVSANSEITTQLLQREEQMIEAFKKLESEKKEQEMEIASLREQLTKLEAGQDRSEDTAGKSNKEQVTIQARISDKELQKKVMYEEVARLRELRKQQDVIKPKPAIRREETRDSENTDNTARQKVEEEKPLNDTQPFIQKQKLNDIDSGKRNTENIPEKKQPSSPTKTLRSHQPVLRNSMSSKMNRSHSTPDLAQALQAEQDPPLKVPSFERALKPANIPTVRMIVRPDLTRKRDFEPVYGSMGRGLTGLKNLGNTCYMNSIIQCLSNCALLTNFLVNGSYRAFLNPSNNPTRGEITDELSSALKVLWCGKYRSVSCRDLKDAVGKYASSFRGTQQQDSHEFLTILIDWLHEELNEVRVKKPLKEQNNKGIPLEEAAQMAWQDYTNSNKSIIVKLFGGQLRSTVQCLTCSEESVTFEPFFNLSLPIPQSRNNCSIMDCFSLYTIAEQVPGWFCPSCKQNRNAKKKIDIWKLPPILVVHLKRFYNDGMWRKRLTMVEFSVNELDLHGAVKSNSARYTRFNLFAVSNHYGASMDSGHYTAYCKNPEFNKWFKFDDQDVMEINSYEVRNSAAYILFYTAINYEAPQFERQNF